VPISPNFYFFHFAIAYDTIFSSKEWKVMTMSIEFDISLSSTAVFFLFSFVSIKLFGHVSTNL